MSLNEKFLHTSISYTHVVNVLKLFRETEVFDANDSSEQHNKVMMMVDILFAADYYCLKLDNNGKLCPNYPPYLLIPMNYVENNFDSPKIEIPAIPKEAIPEEKIIPKGNMKIEDFLSRRMDMRNDEFRPRYGKIIYDGPFEPEKGGEDIKVLVEDAMYGRSRKRFVAPVILYKGKFIARSSTVPLPFEILLRESLDTIKDITLQKLYVEYSDLANIFDKGKSTIEKMADTVTSAFKKVAEFAANIMESNDDQTPEDKETAGRLSEMTKDEIEDKISEAQRCAEADARLLKSLGIKAIFDLMVEYGKVKYGFQCSSSEKEVVEWYKDFDLNRIPYPGCEFFAQFSENKKNAPLLKFDWAHKEVNSDLYLVSEGLLDVQTNWNYQDWGLVHLTSVYLICMLKYIKKSEEGEGLLVHCISGWDRTPLFVSLLRISLWADGEIHKSLNPLQMLYLTISYDWMLFGHNLKNRERKNEEIMNFCFVFLSYIMCEHFSINSSSFGAFNDYIEKDVGSVGSCSEVSSQIFDDETSKPGTPISDLELTPETKLSSTPDPNSTGAIKKARKVVPDQSISEDDSVVTDFVQLDSYNEGNSICLNHCSGCYSRFKEVEETERCKRIKLLRKAYFTCFSRSYPDEHPKRTAAEKIFNYFGKEEEQVMMDSKESIE